MTNEEIANNILWKCKYNPDQLPGMITAALHAAHRAGAAQERARHENEDRVCVSCGYRPKDDLLIDLRYNSQSVARYTCPQCGAALWVREHEHCTYTIERSLDAPDDGAGEAG